MVVRLLTVFFLLAAAAVAAAAQNNSNDTLGLDGGYVTLETAHFSARIVRDAQVLASLRPAARGGDNNNNSSSFDFLPFDLIADRAGDGQYHWGDITYRYRYLSAANNGSGAWIDGDSSAARRPVRAVNATTTTTGGAVVTVLAAANLGATLPAGGPLRVTREWLDVDGDLGLRFTVTNAGGEAVEVGSLGFPAEFDSIFTNRAAAEIEAACSLSDPYVGLGAGYLRANPVSGVGAALVVTPLGAGAGADAASRQLEAYRNLDEPVVDAATDYGSQTFEGLYEWQVHSAAWAGREWAAAAARPWNPPTSRVLRPGEALTAGVRFTVVPEGVRGTDDALRALGLPVAFGVPGFVVPRGEPARLFLSAEAPAAGFASDPAGALVVEQAEYTVTPAADAFGRARLTVEYADGRVQTVHYWVTKAGSEALGDLGSFLTTEQWFNDTSDPFGRAPSVMTYDYENGSVVSQEPRVWIAGLSDEGGVGAYLAAMMKQATQPDAEEVAKLETFIDEVLWGTIQTDDYAVRKSIFYYDPADLPDYPYRTDFDWTEWWSWDKSDSYAIDRAYDYVHVSAAYWSLYRVARAYPDLVQSHTWEWYLNQAFNTIIAAMRSDVGYNTDGLMGETVWGEILADLGRENLTAQAANLTEAMRSRAALWDSQAVPYGSEMAWDSTGQEGVYYWSKYFGYNATALKTVNSVLGYDPAVPHWGWNGNARRYWDFEYAGKLQRIERQIHHYGSALNALVMLGAFRSDPQDSYLLQVGYGGTSGPLSSINDEGFAACGFHSFPETLAWDGYSGDYGPGFLGMVLGSGTYVANHSTYGLLAYGGVIESTTNSNVSVRTQGPVRQRVFIGPLGVTITLDTGVIENFAYSEPTSAVSVTISQLEGGPKAASAVMWVESSPDQGSYVVSGSQVSQARGGWQIPLSSTSVTVVLEMT
ncbi:hypothetical protein GGR56DRAFT_679847 [Xylariaceae sp. FL0804]|nr:hypothetical protein GGR56DRAFT_679847 [Xylariaceae sp. FL0804]